MKNVHVAREITKRSLRERFANMPHAVAQPPKKARPFIGAALAWVLATAGMFASAFVVALALTRFSTQVCS